MLLTTLRAVGGSVMFAIPKPILEGLGLSVNTQVALSVSGGRLIGKRPAKDMVDAVACRSPLL